MKKNQNQNLAASILAGAAAGAAAAAAVIGVYVFLKSDLGQNLLGKAKATAIGTVEKVKAKLPKRVVAENESETVVLEAEA